MFVQVPTNLQIIYMSIILFDLTLTPQGQFGLNLNECKRKLKLRGCDNHQVGHLAFDESRVLTAAP